MPYPSRRGAGPQGPAGQNGKLTAWRVSDGYIQWQYVGDTTWNNMISVATITGKDGESVDLQISGNWLQWKHASDNAWSNLLDISQFEGEAGPPNILTIASVETLPPGSNATAQISGQSPGQSLSLGIPAGIPGNDADAPTISIGSVTKLPAGSQAKVEVTGQSPEFILDFGIPEGEKGTDAQSISVSMGTVTTGAAGSQASASITGTYPNYQLNMTIPRGNVGASNSLTIGTVTTGTPGATITGTAPNQTLNLVLPPGNTGPANSLSIGTVATGPAAASITGTAPSQVLNLTIPQGQAGVSYNPQTPSARTVTVGTAYQHSDTTKPYKCVANVRATQTLTVAGLSVDKLELRVGPNSAAVASGGSGGFSLAVWESGITGIALMIGAGIQDGGQMICDIPAGWYFQINRLSGTSATVVSCFTQAMTA